MYTATYDNSGVPIVINTETKMERSKHDTFEEAQRYAEYLNKLHNKK